MCSGIWAKKHFQVENIPRKMEIQKGIKGRLKYGKNEGI